MESISAGSHPLRGNNQGSQGAACGETRFSAIAQNTMELLHGSSFEDVVGDYNFYKFLVDVDISHQPSGLRWFSALYWSHPLPLFPRGGVYPSPYPRTGPPPLRFSVEQSFY